MHIAIVEDERECSQMLVDYIKRYEEEDNQKFKVTIFSNGLNLLDEYGSGYDIVFLDIEMPHLDGIETARKLRAMDEQVCIIFVTNMAQYAVSGYEVNALDFMVKPVGYFNFKMKLQRAVQQRVRLQKAEVIIKTDTGYRRMPPSDIYYIEVSDHLLSYHTLHGHFSERDTMKKREEQLKQYDFARCNNSYLVNLMHVTEINSRFITVAGTELSISRTKKKSFMNALTKCMGDYMK